jgi:hypothetical protein
MAGSKFRGPDTLQRGLQLENVVGDSKQHLERRILAAELLGKRKDANSIKFLIEVLEKSTEPVPLRYAILVGLQISGVQEIQAPAARLLQNLDENISLRYRALYVLQQGRSPLLKALLETLVNHPRENAAFKASLKDVQRQLLRAAGKTQEAPQSFPNGFPGEPLAAPGAQSGSDLVFFPSPGKQIPIGDPGFHPEAIGDPAKARERWMATENPLSEVEMEKLAEVLKSHPEFRDLLQDARFNNDDKRILIEYYVSMKPTKKSREGQLNFFEMLTRGLPFEFKSVAHVAGNAVLQHARTGRPFDAQFVNNAAKQVHKEWRLRNQVYISSERAGSFHKLSAAEQERFREMLRVSVDLYINATFPDTLPARRLAKRFGLTDREFQWELGKIHPEVSPLEIQRIFGALHPFLEPSDPESRKSFFLHIAKGRLGIEMAMNLAQRLAEESALKACFGFNELLTGTLRGFGPSSLFSFDSSYAGTALKTARVLSIDLHAGELSLVTREGRNLSFQISGGIGEVGEGDLVMFLPPVAGGSGTGKKTIEVEEAASEEEARQKIAEALKEAQAQGAGLAPWTEVESGLIEQVSEGSDISRLKEEILRGNFLSIEKLTGKASEDPEAMKALFDLAGQTDLLSTLKSSIWDGIATLAWEGSESAYHFLSRAAGTDAQAMESLGLMARELEFPQAAERIAELAETTEHGVEELWTLADSGYPSAYSMLVQVARSRYLESRQDKMGLTIVFNLEVRALQGNEAALDALYQIAHFDMNGGKYLHHFIERLGLGFASLPQHYEEWTEPGFLKQLYTVAETAMKAYQARLRDHAPGKKKPGSR